MQLGFMYDWILGRLLPHIYAWSSLTSLRGRQGYVSHSYATLDSIPISAVRGGSGLSSFLRQPWSEFS